MTNKTFVPGTVIDSPWLNDVNDTVYDVLGDGTNVPATKAAARTNLGLGTMATQNANAVAITGGSVAGITDLAIADGGTGASTAAQALLNLGAVGRLLNVQVFVASGTYTPTAGTTTVIVEAVGGGGAGGGANATPAGQISCGAGGGSGAHTLARLANAVSQTITVGAGGVGVLAANGGNGGASSFGALVTAPGGLGGDRALAAGSIANGGGLGAPAGTGGNIYASPGTPGGYVLAYSPICLGSNGATGPFGGGAGVSGDSDGKVALGYGSGGGGGGNHENTATLRTGGNGAAGVVIVYEFT